MAKEHFTDPPSFVVLMPVRQRLVALFTVPLGQSSTWAANAMNSVSSVHALSLSRDPRTASTVSDTRPLCTFGDDEIVNRIVIELASG